MRSQWIEPATLGRIVWLVWLFLLPLTVAANEPAGHVTALAGEVTASADDGVVRALQRGDAIHVGETVATGANSRARLTFTDGGSVTLRPASRLLVEAYHYSGDPESDTQATRLLRGGLRAVTGAIGEGRHESYTLETPLATMGIRGTDFRLRHCQGDCLDLQNIGVEPPLDGLYTQTLVGITQVGQLPVPAGQSSFTDMTGLSMLLPVPPPILQLDPGLGDDAFTESEEGEAGTIDPQPGAGDPEATETEPTADADAALEEFDIPAQSHGPRYLDCR